MKLEPQERDRIRPHVADGISEYDNPLPTWWTGFLYCSVVFSVVYLVVFHMIGWQSLEGDYAAARRQEKQPVAAVATPGVKDPAAIAAGKETFATYCAPCHGAAGEGNIGPNLTDDFWLHGHAPEAVVKTITDGVAEKGMPAWGPVLGPKKVAEAAAFVLTLHGSNPPNPKSPQGEKVSE
jgi:cytochrome c oxidase cbb3-type subunit 3